MAVMFKLSVRKPSNGDRCLVYLGYGWRELYFYTLGNAPGFEGFYTYNGEYVNPYKRDPVWMIAPPYPEEE